MKIVSLELENVKRVSLVRLEPAAAGLTVIGGDNAQGKTSVLDGIMYALGGEKYRPEDFAREGSMADPHIRLELSDGLVVERKGKNASLKVTDSAGRKSGQKLLDTFVEEFSLNLPKFLALKEEDKALTLLRTLGIEDRLADIDQREQVAYDNRRAQNQLLDQKQKYAAEMPEYHDVPATPLSAAELIAESRQIIARNEERARKRAEIGKMTLAAESLSTELEMAKNRVRELEQAYAVLKNDLDVAQQSPITEDESTAELEEKISGMEEINAKIRANLNKEKAQEEADAAKLKADQLSAELDSIRAERQDLLANAALPLPELTVAVNERGKNVLLYKNRHWDCMSGMEQIRVAAAIVRRLKPACQFILLDGLESFDLKSLQELDQWLTEQNLQAIATRVSKGAECTIIIEDGMVAAPEKEPVIEREEW